MMNRRQLLQWGGCTALPVAASTVPLSVWSKDKPASALPAPASLQEALAGAISQNNPLIVMVSLDGCPFCKTARQSYLLPMLNEDKLPIVQVDMRSSRAVMDFQGNATTHDEMVRSWKVRIAPTLLFVGAGGRELAPRLVGASLPDFYGAYLDQRLTTARQALKSS